MNDLVEFIKEQLLNIIGIVFLIIGLLVLIQLYGWNMNPETTQKYTKQITIETMDNQTDSISKEIQEMKLTNPADSFCASHLGKASQLEVSCSELTETNCNQTPCCVYTSNNKCSAGDIHGPTFQRDAEGKPIPLDYYYYLGKKTEIKQ